MSTLYYDTIGAQVLDEYALQVRGLEQAHADVLRSLGMYRLIESQACGHNPYTQYCEISYEAFGEWYITRHRVCQITDPAALQNLLVQFKAQRRAVFSSAFAALEQRAGRPQAAILTALAEGCAPPAPDADILWQVESVKEENRRLLAQLTAARTWEEAAQITPWIPWEHRKAPHGKITPLPKTGSPEQ